MPKDRPNTWTTTRSLALPPEMAARIDALSGADTRASRSAFLRELVVIGLVAKYGTHWEVMADALRPDPVHEAVPA